MRRIINWFNARRARRMRKEIALHCAKVTSYESMLRIMHFIETGEYPVQDMSTAKGRLAGGSTL